MNFKNDIKEEFKLDDNEAQTFDFFLERMHCSIESY